ncbi:MAG: DUF72 domain-containing protein [Candidatus Omnitrophica bacterium CG02_land_8_20_14_3_00__42_8]|nr:MAG: DUF72 domain-containing protein [Candidatus Omnitrophica bacterium CG02_land_8_20_14_3_00__42_8]
MAERYIGTSGFSYPHWEKGVFYPQGLARFKELEYYSQYFQTVELNNPFYRLPATKTFQKWFQQSSPDFIFSVKVSRYITHVKKLKDCRQAWQSFISRAVKLKEKLGPILFQLPPGWPVNVQRLEDFLKILSGSFPARKAPGPPKKYLPQSHPAALKRKLLFNYQYVFEFRHPSWFSPEVYQLLKKYKAALCLADSAQWPYREELTANFVYLRLHGSRALYSSNYTNKELKNWAGQIKKWAKAKDVYVYFNNDACGNAIKNAQKLKKYLNA